MAFKNLRSAKFDQ